MYQFHFTRENSLVALPGIWVLCLDLQHDWDFWLQGYFIAIDHELSIHQGTKIGQEVSIKECVPLNRFWKCTTPKAPQSNLWQCPSAISSNWQTETLLKAVTQIEIDHWWGLGRGSNLDGPLGTLLLFYLWEWGEPNLGTCLLWKSHCASSQIMPRNFIWVLGSWTLSVLMTQSYCCMWIKMASSP